MSRINLLPWREAERAERDRRHMSVAAGVVILMGMVVYYSHVLTNNLIEQQTVRNDFLDKEIAVLDKKIEEIETLESEKSQLLARRDVIQQLQTSRPEVVHIVDELAVTLPEGAFYTSIKQQDKAFSLEGIAQSNARVSTLMHNLDAASWLENPTLDVIETSEKNATRLTRFSLRVTQKMQKEPGSKADTTIAKTMP